MAVSILAVAFAALCVWLMVRLVNRRERWAKRTLAALVAMPVLYVASFGPACWILVSIDSSVRWRWLQAGVVIGVARRSSVPVHSHSGDQLHTTVALGLKNPRIRADNPECSLNRCS